MTIVCNLHGGPGSGKSTSAAYIFSKLKQAGVNAELVREYVKDWAWDGRPIGEFDQLYLLGKQMRRETMLFGKVDVIVTDSPLYLAAFFAGKFSPPILAKATLSAAEAVVKHAESIGHKYVHYFIERTKTYNPAGRYQTEVEARDLDVDILCFMMDNNLVPGLKNFVINTDPAELDCLAAHLTELVGVPTKEA